VIGVQDASPGGSWVAAKLATGGLLVIVTVSVEMEPATYRGIGTALMSTNFRSGTFNDKVVVPLVGLDMISKATLARRVLVFMSAGPCGARYVKPIMISVGLCAIAIRPCVPAPFQLHPPAAAPPYIGQSVSPPPNKIVLPAPSGYPLVEVGSACGTSTDGS